MKSNGEKLVVKSQNSRYPIKEQEMFMFNTPRRLSVDKNFCILVHLGNPENQASKAPVVLPDCINKQYFMF